MIDKIELNFADNGEVEIFADQPFKVVNKKTKETVTSHAPGVFYSGDATEAALITVRYGQQLEIKATT